MFTQSESETAVVSCSVPGLQVPEGGIVIGPGVGRFWCRHKRVVLHVLLSVGYQTDREEKRGEREGRAGLS